MMKKQLYILGIVVCTAVAIIASYFYAQRGNAWLLAVSCCAVLLLLLCIVGIAREYKLNKATPKLYRKKPRYLTQSEQEFFRTLKSIVGNRYDVYPQAPLVSVIDKPNASFRSELFRVADYIVVNPVTSEPLLLIELNDASHNRADRKARDGKVADICADAGIPLIAFTIAESRDINGVRRKIFKTLK